MIFNENLCKIAEQYLKKGAKVYIEGPLQTRKWQGQDGQDQLQHRSGAAELQRHADHAGLRGAAAALVPARACTRTIRPTMRRPATATAPAAAASRARKGGFDKKIDDEIPF